MEDSDYVVVKAFTNVHEAHFARSVLIAGGIDTVVADEHVVSMDWFLSNAVGGVKLLVPANQLDEARAILDTEAAVAGDDPIRLTEDTPPK